MSESYQNLKLIPLPDNKLYKFEKFSISSPTLLKIIREIIQKKRLLCPNKKI